MSAGRWWQGAGVDKRGGGGEGKGGKNCCKKSIPFIHVLNSSSGLKGIERAEKKEITSEKTERLQPRWVMACQPG